VVHFVKIMVLQGCENRVWIIAEFVELRDSTCQRNLECSASSAALRWVFSIVDARDDKAGEAMRAPGVQRKTGDQNW